MEMGGSNSHGAVVAREYGIPAVMATTDGTHILTDGQRVRVDGSQGLVLATALANTLRDGEPTNA